MKAWIGNLIAGLALASSYTGVVGCGSNSQKKDTIRIGALISATGELASIGQREREAAQLAVTEINNAGGVLGKQLELVAADDATDPTTAAIAAKDLAEQGAVAVIGATGSRATLAAAGVLPGYHVTLISASATSPSISTFADNDFLFRTCPSDALQGKLLAQRAKLKGFTKGAVTYVPGAYGQGLAEVFKEVFEANGGTVTYFAPYTENQAQYTYLTLLDDIHQTNPEFILLAGYPVDGSKIVKAWLISKDDWLPQPFWFFGDAVSCTDFITGVGANEFSQFPHEGTVSAAPENEQWNHLVQAYQAMFDKAIDPSAYPAQAYDALYVVALAIAQAGVADGQAVRDALRKVTVEGGEAFTPMQFKDAVAAIQAGKSIAYQGVTGAVQFDANGDDTASAYNIWKVENGQVNIIEHAVDPEP